MNNRLSIVITNYNTWTETIKCISKCLELSDEFINEIIVVDDHSSEAISLDYISPKVKTIRNKINLGYVKSVNIGVNTATSDIILLIDSDAYPITDLKEILEKFEHQDLDALGVKLVDENLKQTGSTEEIPDSLSLILGQKLYAWFSRYFKKSNNMICVFSCFISFRKKAFEQIGGFDEDFDFLDADIDFSIRLNKDGFKVIYDDKILAYHVGSGSPQSIEKRVQRFYQNRWKLLKKHNLVRNTFMVKSLILLRLNIELLILRFLLKDAKYKEKFRTRVKLINEVKAFK